MDCIDFEWYFVRKQHSYDKYQLLHVSSIVYCLSGYEHQALLCGLLRVFIFIFIYIFYSFNLSIGTEEEEQSQMVPSCQWH